MAYDRPSARTANTTGSGASRRVVTSVAIRKAPEAKTVHASCRTGVRVTGALAGRPAFCTHSMAAHTRVHAVSRPSPVSVATSPATDACEPSSPSHVTDDRGATGSTSQPTGPAVATHRVTPAPWDAEID